VHTWCFSIGSGYVNKAHQPLVLKLVPSVKNASHKDSDEFQYKS